MGDLHPEMRKVLDQYDRDLSAMGLSDIHSGGVERARAFSKASPPPPEVLLPVHRVVARAAPGPGGEIPVRVYYPTQQKNLPVLVWFHGGGWVLGDLDDAEYECRRLVNDVGCAVVSVGYRLAPETPFPGALDDCLAATRWVAESAAELGIDPQRIAVGGESAGGNLAACVALKARESGPPLVFQLLVYPVIDADFDRPSYRENAEGYLLSREAMRWFWDCYVPDVAARADPGVSPLCADSLAGLPPALVFTAEFDLLRDEGEAYGAALAAAGVPVETRRYDGVIHGFFYMLTEEPVPEVEQASADAARALKGAFA